MHPSAKICLRPEKPGHHARPNRALPHHHCAWPQYHFRCQITQPVVAHPYHEDRQFQKYGDITNITALLEMCREQSFGNHMLLAGAGRPPNEPVCVECIGVILSYQGKINECAFSSHLYVLAHFLSTFFTITLFYLVVRSAPSGGVLGKLIGAPH